MGSFHCLLWFTTCRGIHSLQSEVPQTVLTGNTADISPLVEFDFYDWVWFTPPATLGTPYHKDEDGKNYPDGYDGYDKLEKRQLGRYLGPSGPCVGTYMVSKIL